MSDTEQFFFNSRCAILQSRLEKIFEDFSQEEKEGVLIELILQAILEYDDPVLVMNSFFSFIKDRIKKTTRSVN